MMWPRGTSRIVKLLRKQGEYRRLRAKAVAVSRARAGDAFRLSPSLRAAITLGWRVY